MHSQFEDEDYTCFILVLGPRAEVLGARNTQGAGCGRSGSGLQKPRRVHLNSPYLRSGSWNNAKAAPCGSMRTAIVPTSFISSAGKIVEAPACAALAALALQSATWK